MFCMHGSYMEVLLDYQYKAIPSCIPCYIYPITNPLHVINHIFGQAGVLVSVQSTPSTSQEKKTTWAMPSSNAKHCTKKRKERNPIDILGQPSHWPGISMQKEIHPKLVIFPPDEGLEAWSKHIGQG